MKHDELADEIVRWLTAMNRMTWTNFRYDTFGTGRPDVFSISKKVNMATCSPMVHEIKVSRSDFQSDVRSEKWRKYQSFSKHIFFVVPAGMVAATEVPPETGLIWYDGTKEFWNKRYVTKKKSTVNKAWKFEDELVMRLLIGRWGTESPAAKTVERLAKIEGL